LRQNSSAVRSPALAPVPSAPAPAPPYTGPATIESLGRQLRDVLPTRRVHSVSVWDAEANVLWLSEGALGPDEHSMVSEALEKLGADQALPCHEMGLEDGRLTLFLPVRAPDASLVGIAMVLADGKSLGDDTHERMAAQPVRAILMRLAVLMKPEEKAQSTPRAEETSAAAGTQDARAPSAGEPLSAENVNDILEFDLSPEDTGHAHLPQPAADPSTTSARESVLLEFTDEPTEPAITPQASAVAPVSVAAAPAAAVDEPAAARTVSAPTRELSGKAASEPASKTANEPATGKAASASPPAVVSELPGHAASDASLLLEILPYAKLRPGGQTRRFQVLARMAAPPRDPAVQDALVLQRLMSWLASHRSAWNAQPTGFTVSLSIATLEDERFAQKLAAALNSHGISAESLGFEIAESLCTQRRAHVERFIAQCEKVGAWVVIDSFGFDAQTVPLLRSKALRLVKIDPKLTGAALKDKLSQAMVVAAVQAAKVLGIHCAAQKVDSQAALQWLTAIGCDFAQGAVLGRTHSLDSIGSLPDTTAVTEHLRTSRAE
jgi:EAL domain-containing protein (putative c-di-GMP-specific phosphodiesterase class I)